ncbi:RNB domain-containing ribonuclease, partial [Patescibacteria group bacterium]|nr:RNB domain-containing ribonuclease [Patescibacteria group bacterium]
LVDATIPMLPHELSGNVCSLKADEDRLAFSAIFNITKTGEVLNRRFEKTIIRSNKRFTYEEAQGLLNAKDMGEFGKPLATLWSIAQIFRKEKERRGAIDFGDNEVRFTLDENGVPTGVVRKERIDTNLLIEEYMLLANREVAKYVSKLAEKNPEHGLVFLYRIHDDPKDDRIEELATFVRAIGYDFGKKGKKPTAKDISNLLDQIEGKPEEHLIRTATLRSMAKAIYSTRNIGHFGLAFDYYTHFTSPIRRYPDVLVHRILMSHLDGHPMNRREFTALERMCITASEQEAKAVSAERDSIRYKQVEYLSSRIGQEFDAVISGVTDWGIYVEDKVTASEGLVRMRALQGDFFEHRPKEYAVVGQRTQKKYALGDSVRVRLIAADLAARTADFELVS